MKQFFIIILLGFALCMQGQIPHEYEYLSKRYLVDRDLSVKDSLYNVVENDKKIKNPLFFIERFKHKGFFPTYTLELVQHLINNNYVVRDNKLVQIINLIYCDTQSNSILSDVEGKPVYCFIDPKYYPKSFKRIKQFYYQNLQMLENPWYLLDSLIIRDIINEHEIKSLILLKSNSNECNDNLIYDKDSFGKTIYTYLKELDLKECQKLLYSLSRQTDFCNDTTQAHPFLIEPLFLDGTPFYWNEMFIENESYDTGRDYNEIFHLLFSCECRFFNINDKFQYVLDLIYKSSKPILLEPIQDYLLCCDDLNKKLDLFCSRRKFTEQEFIDVFLIKDNLPKDKNEWEEVWLFCME
jgi:hypothetical protein